MAGSLGVDAAAWARASPLLDELLDLDESARAARLAALPEADADLRPLLARLLAESTDHLPTRVPLAADAFDHAAGERVGPWRLLDRLGEGGMGEVWRAERADGLLERQVALKLPRAGALPGDLAARMARERNILAALVHPGIARLYDAGIGEGGQPFLALELVEGERIDRHADRLQLDLPARLRLALQAVRAVAHAHAQLVVHRDLKPANLLVDRDGQVKLLDFGIAKLLDRDTNPDLTAQGARPMTPAYASPEQVAGAPVGTHSDIYSLGVLLFELTAGSSPYGVARTSPAALEAAVLQGDLPAPSARAADRQRARALKGDVDTIVLRALARRPEDRYPTADALGDDIERHLAHQPILARPAGAMLVLRKWVRRHRGAFAAGVAVAAALVAGVAVALWQAQVAKQERLRAEQVKTFVAGILRDASPYNGRDVAQLSAADLVHQADERLRAARITSPAVRAELGTLIGESLLTLGDLDAAEPVLQRVAEDARRELGDADRQTLHARLLQSQVLRFRGQAQQQQQELQQVLAALRGRAGAEPELLVEALEGAALNAIDRGAFDEAESLALEARAVARERLGPNGPDAAGAALALATAHRYARHFEQSRQVAEEALALVRAAYPPRHPRLMEAQSLYGRVLADLGQLAAGIEQLEAAARLAKELHGPDSVQAATLRQNLVAYQIDWGDTAAAVDNGREALRVIGAQATPESFTHAATTSALGQALLADGRAEEALVPLQSAAERLQRALGPAHDSALFAAANAALALARNGRPAEALGRLDGLAAALAGPAVNAATRARATLARAVAQLAAGQPAAALAQLTPLLADTDPAPRLQRERLRARLEAGRAQFALGRRPEAVALFEAAQAEAARLQSPASPLAATALRELARARGS
ncbi:MAG: serine/threonine-protein kinase [Rubrivivax sp.]